MREQLNHVVSLNGKMVTASKALLNRLTPGLMNGVGVFETMRAYSGKIFMLNEHCERLLRGLKTLGIKSPYSKKEISSCLAHVLNLSNLKQGRIRLTIWRDHSSSHMAIVAGLYQPLPAAIYQKGFKAKVMKERYCERLPLSNIKSVDYGFYRIAYKKALRYGYDEAVVLNKEGYLVEGARTNIFIVKDGCLMTPDIRSGCLDGITRQVVIKLALAKGIKCRQCDILTEDLIMADEAFLTNSIIEIMPLTHVDDNMINKGKVALITKLLMKAYKEYVLYKLKKDCTVSI